MKLFKKKDKVKVKTSVDNKIVAEWEALDYAQKEMKHSMIIEEINADNILVGRYWNKKRINGFRYNITKEEAQKLTPSMLGREVDIILTNKGD